MQHVGHWLPEAGGNQLPPSAWKRLNTACRRASRATTRLSSAVNRVCWVCSTVTRSTVPSRNLVSASWKAWREVLTTTCCRRSRSARVGDGDQRDLHVTEAGEDGLAIDLQQLELPALRQFQLSLQPEAVEQRLRDIDREVVEGLLRSEQQLEHVAFVPALSGERDAREEGGARGLDAGVGGGEVGLGCSDVGTLQQQLRRQPRRDPRDAQSIEAAALHVEIGRRAAHQRR